MAQGVPIKYGVFRMKPETPDFDPTRYHLRNRAIPPEERR